jgi:hypothetical protein
VTTCSGRHACGFDSRRRPWTWPCSIPPEQHSSILPSRSRNTASLACSTHYLPALTTSPPPDDGCTADTCLRDTDALVLQHPRTPLVHLDPSAARRRQSRVGAAHARRRGASPSPTHTRTALTLSLVCSFVPADVPRKRRLQMLAVAVWSTTIVLTTFVWLLLWCVAVPSLAHLTAGLRYPPMDVGVTV